MKFRWWKLEKELLPKVGIFVDNDALAFFDVNIPLLQSIPRTHEPIDVEKLKDEPVQYDYDVPYHFLVRNRCYFRIGKYEGRLWTVSITTPCIVFCAYTTSLLGGVKFSGVYHAESRPGSTSFQNKLYELIDTVRQTHEQQQITVKGAGDDGNAEYLQHCRDQIIEILAKKNVKIKPSHLLLGGGQYRITEFHPQTGELITYFDGDEQKTIS